jgi:hypothetical protein
MRYRATVNRLMHRYDAMPTEGGGMNAASLFQWIARITSLASLAFIVMMALGEGGVPTTAEAVGLLLFPVGVLGGLLVAWRRELLGGLLSLASLALFYLWVLSRSGHLPAEPYFALVAAPAMPFLLSWLLMRRLVLATTRPATVSQLPVPFQTSRRSWQSNSVCSMPFLHIRAIDASTRFPSRSSNLL